GAGGGGGGGAAGGGAPPAGRPGRGGGGPPGGRRSSVPLETAFAAEVQRPPGAVQPVPRRRHLHRHAADRIGREQTIRGCRLRRLRAAAAAQRNHLGKRGQGDLFLAGGVGSARRRPDPCQGRVWKPPPAQRVQ